MSQQLETKQKNFFRAHKEAETGAEAEAEAEKWTLAGGEVEPGAAGHGLVLKTGSRCGGLELVVEEVLLLLLLRPALLCGAQVVVRLRGRGRADFCRP